MKIHALFAAVLLAGYALGLPLDAAALTLTRGPYLQLGTQSSIVVRWRTETATNSRVRYGTNASSLSSVVDDSTLATEHVVKLTGLNPSTKYYYSVGNSEATLAGGTDHFFVAAPIPGTEQPTHIWVLRNSGTAIAKARAVRDAYFSYKGNQYTHLWLMLGDNASRNGTDSDYDALFNTYPTLLRQTTLWPTLGHRDDRVTADSASQSGAYYDIFTLPKQGEAGGLASGTEACYSFDYSNIHFVVLDSMESSKAPSGAMLTWLENDLAVTTQPWIIAYWDHPPCSQGFHDSDTEIAVREMRENVLPTLEDSSVDLVLNEDCSSYERSFLIDGRSGSSVTFEPQAMLVDDGEGEYQTSVIDRPIRDAVVGSSGETQVGSLDYPAIYVSLKTLGSMALNVNGPLLDAVFLDNTGQVRDRFRMVKTTDTAKAITSAPDVPTTEVNPTLQTATVSPTGGTVGDAAGKRSSSGSSIVGATTQGVSSTSNLVAHWTLDTQNVDPTQSSAEVRDVSGYNNDADLKNRSATTVPGKLGQALSLDGVDDYAEKISFSGLPSSAITVSAWVKLDAHKNWNRVLNHEWVNNGRLLFTDASGTARFGARQSGVQYNAIKAGLTVGSWYHLVGVYDGSNVRIYVNGQQGTPGAKSGLILDSGGNVDIGGAERDRFKGAIDDVRIYSKVLTASEVQALYNVGGTTDTSPRSPPTNLTANAVSSSQINLSWNASADNVRVTGYKVYRGGAQIATTTVTSYSNTGLSPSRTYSYAVAAYDAAGNTSAQSTSVGATTQAAPDTAAPSAFTNLTASAVSSSQINLVWTSSTDNVAVTGYKIYRGGTQMTTVSGTSYQNTGLAPSTAYNYTVAAYDAAGNTSAQSSSASATTQAATLSITSYGATGNDTTDDTTAIKNTITAAKSQGKGVYVPLGTFRYTSFRFNGITLTGGGATSILYAPNQASSKIILNGNGPVLKNLKVQTNGTSRTGADHNIFVEGATNFTIDNVEVTGSASAAILTYGSSGPGKIINNYVHDTFSDGIHNTGGAHDIIVANNRVRNTGDDMIAAVSYGTPVVRNILVQDNDVAGNTGGRGITSIGSSDITIQRNTVGQTSGAGILVATEPSYTSPPLSNVLARNNTLSNNATVTGGHGGMMISALNGNIDKVRFEGNTITNPKNDSIKLEGANTNTALVNNTMIDPENNGIRITVGTNVYCSGNTLNGSANSNRGCTGANNFTVTGSSLTY